MLQEDFEFGVYDGHHTYHEGHGLYPKNFIVIVSLLLLLLLISLQEGALIVMICDVSKQLPWRCPF